ncbi:MAG: divergent PAP2 family protein [Parcubacteria group bacterium]
MFNIIIVPVVSALLAQIIKAVINGFRDKFSWRDLVTYGGMPSSHAALVTSLALMAGLTDGWDSAAFAIALFLAILIIRDAGGYRMEMSKHAVELNKIISKLSANLPAPSVSSSVESVPFLKEQIGHYPLELFFGCLLGVAVVVVSIII